MPLPCDKCKGACCRDAGYGYAVMLNRGEHFDKAVQFPGEGLVIPYKRGKCVYLGKDSRCTIYTKRPSRCRCFSCLVCLQALKKTGRDLFLEDHPKVLQLLRTGTNKKPITV